MLNDFLEGLRSEHADSMREERLIRNSMRKEHINHMDDYPEFYYG